MNNDKVWLSYLKTASGILIGIVVLIPIYMMLVSSIKPNIEVFDMKFIPVHVSFEGYIRAWKQGFYVYFYNSFIIAFFVAIAGLVFHSMSGYALARLKFTGKNTVFLWMLSTMMIPFSVIMIPLFIIVKSFGWLNTFQGIMIPLIPHAYGIFLYRQFFLTIPKDLEEAATIDGCSKFRIYKDIFLPLSKSITITLGVSFFIVNWNNYLWPLIVAQKTKMWVLQVAIANFVGRDDTRWDAIMASGVIAVLPTVIIFFILQKYLVEGIKMSGIK